MAIKKIIDWAGNSWIVTGIVLVWLARRWIWAALVFAGAYLISFSERAAQEAEETAQVREYERYKTE